MCVDNTLKQKIKGKKQKISKKEKYNKFRFFFSSMSNNNKRSPHIQCVHENLKNFILTLLIF